MNLHPPEAGVNAGRPEPEIQTVLQILGGLQRRMQVLETVDHPRTPLWETIAAHHLPSLLEVTLRRFRKDLPLEARIESVNWGPVHAVPLLENNPPIVGFI